MPLSGRAFTLLLGSVGLYASATYGGYHAYRIYAAPDPPPGIDDPKKQACYAGVWDSLASSYDSAIGWDEFFMGLGSLRKQLLAQAHGRVLEISAGTGRNMDYYTKDRISHLTISDTNEPMLQKAWSKTRIPSLRNRLPPLDFRVIDSEQIPAQAGQFDTVLETFGLCSCSDPVAALKEMGRVCKPDGKILLLEHGRSHKHDWMNQALDKSAEDHAKTWGCWWNRDIEGMVKQAGLELVDLKRSHFGTTLWIVAKPGHSKEEIDIGQSSVSRELPKTLQLPLLAAAAVLRSKRLGGSGTLSFLHATRMYPIAATRLAPIPTRFLHHTRPILSEQKSNPPAPTQSFSKMPLGVTGDRTLLIGMTCKVCKHRQYKPMSKTAYDKGIVLIRCDGCQNLHLIADNIGWFDKPGNIERILEQKGEKVQKMQLGEHASEGLQIVPEGVTPESQSIDANLQLPGGSDKK
ncbi:Methyltransferase-like protein 7B [Rhizophlyctis rosea]|uniref:Methyltransferase-like protein 7B n=1 Tax=Rhizophlyctis rosea TaxID=64517 RepID=A0AAD5SG16_9FUNG|nr:Methyltransferase-like protein 7B [Rhizophlyctis rosea]